MHLLLPSRPISFRSPGLSLCFRFSILFISYTYSLADFSQSLSDPHHTPSYTTRTLRRLSFFTDVLYPLEVFSPRLSKTMLFLDSLDWLTQGATALGEQERAGAFLIGTGAHLSVCSRDAFVFLTSERQRMHA